MTEIGRNGASVYLRGWDDHETYLVKRIGSHTSGLGHVASERAARPRWSIAPLEVSDRRIVAMEWDSSHGPALRFHDPDGHVLEISDETVW